jgi:hypothetical protein
MGGRLLLQRGGHPVVPAGRPAERRKKPPDLPGQPRGSSASQGDDSASSWTLKAVPGRATTVVNCPTEPEPNVADSAEDRRIDEDNAGKLAG